MENKTARPEGLQEYLLEFYEKRRAGHRHYSKRIFAQDLGISSGRLTTLLNSENIPSPKVLQRIKIALEMTDSEAQFLEELVQKMKTLRVQTRDCHIVLKESDLDVICDWVPFAILSLMETANFKLLPEEIAPRLGVDLMRIENALAQLRNLMLIVEENGMWISSKAKITTTTDIPSNKIIASHLQKLELASAKIKQVPMKLRNYSSITFPADLNTMTKAKTLTIKYQKELAELMQTSKATEVYCLNVQLFPLTTTPKENTCPSKSF